MRLTHLFPKPSKTAPRDADAANARFLTQGGFVHQEMAGVYSWLPLGLRVLTKIENIIREEMNALGAQEILMPALQPKENWLKTGRWDGLDVLFKLKSKIGNEAALGATAEEIITPLAGAYISSYKDLPLALYQIQNKYRDELRAKSGVLRGREFGMKDLYSFHADEDDLTQYYEKVAQTYSVIFKRCGLDAVRARASGGTFSKFSDEFQVLAPAGEDTIYYCPKCKIYYNDELIKDKKCSAGHAVEGGQKAIEVGNIFPLKTKYSDAFDFKYLDKDGQRKIVLMGCYGIGTTRLVGAIVEASHDEKGIIWPAAVVPFKAYLISLKGAEQEAEKLYGELAGAGIDVLFDDRADTSAGEKFADADLIGCPVRLVVSTKTLKENAVEWKERSQEKTKLITLSEVIKTLNPKP